MIGLIVAHGQNREIGFKGNMPWHIPQDLRRFQNLTYGQSVIMGRKTLESIGGPLPGRVNYILSSTKKYEGPNVVMVPSVDIAARDAAQKGLNLYIGGGAALYEQALPLCDFLYITKVHQTFAADTFFPAFDESNYLLLLERRVKAPIPYTFYTYGKKVSPAKP